MTWQKVLRRSYSTADTFAKKKISLKFAPTKIARHRKREERGKKDLLNRVTDINQSKR